MLKLENVMWNLPDGKELIKNINLEINRGKLTVITGPNGGGKTTLAKLVAGIEAPLGGRILLDGEDITHMDATSRAQKGIAYAFQQPVRFKGLTVRDLLELSAEKELDDDELCKLLGKVGLCPEEYINRELSAALSGGESKRIEIATVLARNAPFSVFDEPEAGIDLWSFTHLVGTFEELRQNHTGTLLIISHQERILSIADDIVVVADGQIRAAGPKDKVMPMLLSDERAMRCPLGKEEPCDE